MNTIKLNTTATRVVYWTFQILICITMIASIVQLCVSDSQVKRNTQVSHIMLCVVALVLYNIPLFMQWKFKLYVPSVIHVFVLLFIFAHFVLGEVVGVYTTSAVFDKILHATSGLAIALGGFSLVNLLNTETNSAMKLSPFFVALFSFCFALGIALLWEIFEYAADSLFGMNMQRWDPPEEIKKAVADGLREPPKQGYGLVDTMGDVIVSTISALVVSVAGFVILKRKQQLLNRFLIRKIPDYDVAIQEATEAGDEKLVEALVKARADAVAQIGGEQKLDDLATEPAENTAPSASGETEEEAEAPSDAVAATETTETSAEETPAEEND